VSNSISYCHFPSAKFYLQSEDSAYLERPLKIGRRLSLSSNSATTDKIEKNNAYQKNGDFNKKWRLNWVKYTYDNLMKNSTIFTNSGYTKKAIFDAYGVDDDIVLNSPLDVDTFRNFASS
jgi:hypothetical protein